MNTLRSFNVIIGSLFFKCYDGVKDITIYHIDVNDTAQKKYIQDTQFTEQVNEIHFIKDLCLNWLS